MGGGGGGLAGSSSGSGRPKGGGGAGGAPEDDPCALRFEVDLEGIDVTVLSTVPIAMALDVAVVRQGQYEAVVTRAPAGVVGTLAGFRGLGTLIQCLRDGNGYAATVTAKTATTCRVSVRRTVTP